MLVLLYYCTDGLSCFATKKTLTVNSSVTGKTMLKEEASLLVKDMCCSLTERHYKDRCHYCFGKTILRQVKLPYL